MQSPSDPLTPSVPPSGGAAGAPVGHYNFAWCLEYFAKHGRKQFGPQFTIRKADHDLIYYLLVYFLSDAPEAERLGIDLSKGIFLSGPIGCGKTSIMTLMRTVPRPERSFRIRSTRDVSFEFVQDGYEVIHRYSKLSYAEYGPRIYCFDDLGAEQALKLYGNECNVMAEIILSRYDYFKSQGMLTHITSNLKATEIETMYGPRVRSRMREMFNIVAYGQQAPDQRK